MEKVFKKGTVRFLDYTVHNNWEHLYVKLDDEDFGWWRLENLSIAPERRMMVRTTTERVESETHFTVLSAYGICVDLKTNRICIITDRTENSVEVYMRKVSDAGIDCKNWYTEKDFLKNYFPIPIDVEAKVEEPVSGILTERMKKEDVDKVKEIIEITIKENKQLKYPGYMSDEVQAFCGGSIKSEQREGIGAVGYFLQTSSGKSHLLGKGDIIIKSENGISVKDVYGKII